MYNARLPWKPILLLLSLALVWGANMAIIKIGNREIAPFFTPVLGVLLTGILIMGETIRLNRSIALVLVSLGLVLVNHQPPVRSVSLSEP
jgi:drug/metabolite transporter (DMT)-like permease